MAEMTPGMAEEDLYALAPVRREGWLEVGQSHTLYWEESGNPDGIPAVYLHGGPGSSAAPFYRRFFNPQRYRTVLFDQRGAGRSRPYASVIGNTTADLVADIERLRKHLGIERWLVMGGSWGSTLALAYAEAHPNRVLAIVLRGVFLFTAREVEWFLHGMGRIFSEAGEAFRTYLPEDERDNLLVNYHRRLIDTDPAVHGPAAAAWTTYEDSCSRLIGKPGGGGDSLAMARLEAHYMINDGFLAEGELLANIGRITHLPAVIVQGRYDIVCPYESAYAVHQAWPGSELVTVADAGHSALEPGIRRALREAADKFADLLEPVGAGGTDSGG